jgi:dihydrofolate reductase
MDGAVQSPRAWLAMSEELQAAVGAQLASTDALLLGRVTYKEFAARWPHRTGELADWMNTARKFVVSASLETCEWHNSSLINGDGNVVEELTALKKQPGRNIGVLGSETLVRSLTRRGLLDELTVWVQPVIRGGGRRLFKDLTEPPELELIDSKTLASGVVSLTYELVSARRPELEVARSGAIAAA